MILTPNAQEVTDYFEGAEVVTCLSDNLDYTFEISGLHYDGNTDSWYIYASDDEHGAISILIWSSRLEKYATIVKGVNKVSYEDANDYTKGQMDLIQLIKNDVSVFVEEKQNIENLALDILLLLKKLEPIQRSSDKYVFTPGTNMSVNDFYREQEDETNTRPDRYSSAEVNGMDVIDLVKHWRLNFNEGNILKYLLRDKGEDMSDMGKIEVFAGREKEYLKIKSK